MGDGLFNPLLPVIVLLLGTPYWAQSSSVHRAAFSVDIETLIELMHRISTYPSLGHGL